ncbi:hypothetical protein VHEMI08282 [[Torrubiella] hemipterigena]|uniref:FAD-binding PCMH-type domain-containing protein n=1 Tax=[Torrubiella] hemipterigena TaxID=1531966 RepID=A0A0A1TCY3_9HYPO|nr:hypothetical protein VHEMI08282 [[Torrubiella] hemipterigena]
MVTLNDTSSLDCPFTLPNRGGPLTDYFTRFSEAHVQHPAIIVTPTSEDHVIAAIQFAKANNLSLFAATGGHGTFACIGPNTMFMNMAAFQAINLDQKRGQVEVGGGVITGQLLKSLAKIGYYTTLANANAVGVVAAILGGGNSAYNGLHGFMADNAIRFRVVTSTGDVQDIGASCTGDELALFNTLCGAGHGLGIVLSVKFRAYSIKSLGLTDGKLWSRVMFFPPTALEDVAEAFTSLSPPDKRLSITFTMARGPPSTPFEGKPLIVLAALYFGPSEAAEQAAASLIAPELQQKALMVNQEPLAFENTNDALEKMYSYGGARSTNGCRVQTLSASSIISMFNTFVAFTNGAEKAGIVLHSFNPSQLTANGHDPDLGSRSVECRDFGFTLVMSLWCSSEAKLAEANDGFVEEMLTLVGTDDDHLMLRTFPNVMKFKQDITEMFTPTRIAQMRQVKQRWDPECVFWSPYNFEP